MIEIVSTTPVEVPESLGAKLAPVLRELTSRRSFSWQGLLGVCSTIYLSAYEAATLPEVPFPMTTLVCGDQDGIAFSLTPDPPVDGLFTGFCIDYLNRRPPFLRDLSFSRDSEGRWDIANSHPKPRQVAIGLVQALQNPSNRIRLL